jgi:hypothetical protein
MGAPPQDWALGVSPLPETIVPLTAVEAEAAFLERFDLLTRP